MGRHRGVAEWTEKQSCSYSLLRPFSVSSDQGNILAKPRLSTTCPRLSTMHSTRGASRRALSLSGKDYSLSFSSCLPVAAPVLPPHGVLTFRCICFFLDLPGTDVCSRGSPQPGLASLKRCLISLSASLDFWPRTFHLIDRTRERPETAGRWLLCSPPLQVPSSSGVE